MTIVKNVTISWELNLVLFTPNEALSDVNLICVALLET